MILHPLVKRLGPHLTPVRCRLGSFTLLLWPINLALVNLRTRKLWPTVRHSLWTPGPVPLKKTRVIWGPIKLLPAKVLIPLQTWTTVFPNPKVL